MSERERTMSDDITADFARTSALVCADYVRTLNPLGLIDEAYAEWVGAIEHVDMFQCDEGEAWTLNVLGEEYTLASCEVTHKHQVAKILAAYGIEV